MRKGIKLGKALLITYIITSALFIILSGYNYFKYSVYNAGFQEGLQSGQLGTLQTLINENKKSACKHPITVAAGKDNMIQVIDIKCIQQAQTGIPETQVSEEVAPKVK